MLVIWINVQMLAVSKSPSLLRTVPRVPGNISILGIKLSDQIRKTYCLTVMIPDFVWFLYGLILYEMGMLSFWTALFECTVNRVHKLRETVSTGC